MFAWSRDWIMRQVLAEKGPKSDTWLRLEIAMRLYGNEEPVRRMIEQALSHASD
jgi:hypothetical protein